MAVKASPETIREMKKELSNTIRDIEKISNGIKRGVAATSNWDDAQAAQFNMLMQRIARLTATPIDTLNVIRVIEKLVVRWWKSLVIHCRLRLLLLWLSARRNVKKDITVF